MRSSEMPNPRPFRGRRRGRLTAVALMTAAFAASLAAIAIASAGTPTVKSAHNKKLGQIVVDAHGRSLYVLSPETARHLLCKTRECFASWPPLTVASRKTKLKKGAGVHGRLTILRRSSGKLQVMLDGMPLYHYIGDVRKGEVKGQNIHTFGGVWHVVSARRHSKSMSWSGTSTTSSTGTAMTTSTGWPASTSSSSAGSTTSTFSTTTSTTPSTSTTVTKSTTSCFYPPCY
jgi:predicted lipoprotein with Yx(FWY)xxD motif